MLGPQFLTPRVNCKAQVKIWSKRAQGPPNQSQNILAAATYLNFKTSFLATSLQAL